MTFDLTGIQLLFGVLISAITLGTFIYSIITAYRNSVRKSYASERQWNHLHNDYQQLSQNVTILSKEIEELKTEIKMSLSWLDRLTDKILDKG